MKYPSLIKKSLLLPLVFILSACTELYDPVIDTLEPVLVVEALITNQQGPHVVSLSYSNKFGDNISPVRVIGARVHIQDQQGDIIHFEERSPGRYLSPDDFAGQPGNTYTLFIETKEGETYASSPQTMPYPVSIDSVGGEFSTESFYTHSAVSNTVYETQVEVMKVYLDISSPRSQQVPMFRTQTILMLFYESGGPGEFDKSQCWQKKNITMYAGQEVSNAAAGSQNNRHYVGFVPHFNRDLYYIDFELPMAYERRIVINEVYTISEDTHHFYKTREQQLGDEGMLFDPIAVQMPTNIRGTSEEAGMVFGLFEVSALEHVSYSPVATLNHVDIIMLEDYHLISDHGCLLNAYPPFFF